MQHTNSINTKEFKRKVLHWETRQDFKVEMNHKEFLIIKGTLVLYCKTSLTIKTIS